MPAHVAHVIVVLGLLRERERKERERERKKERERELPDWIGSRVKRAKATRGGKEISGECNSKVEAIQMIQIHFLTANSQTQ
jgi:hypothetical protein